MVRDIIPIESLYNYNGNFAPFGVFGHGADIAINNLASGNRFKRMLAVVYRTYMKTLFRARLLSWLVVFDVVFYSSLIHSEYKPMIFTSFSTGAPCYHLLILLLLCLLSLLANLLLAIESLFLYCAMGRHAMILYHNRTGKKGSAEGKSMLLFELLFLFKRISVAVAFSAMASFCCYLLFNGYADNPSLVFSGHEKVDIALKNQQGINYFVCFLQFIYFSITTIATVGYGDISPSRAHLKSL